MTSTVRWLFLAVLLGSSIQVDNHKLLSRSMTDDREIRKQVLADFRRQGAGGVEWLLRFAKNSHPDRGWHAVDVLASLQTPDSRRGLCRILDGRYDELLVTRALRSGKELAGCGESVARWIERGSIGMAASASESLAEIDLPRAIAATARRLQKVVPTGKNTSSVRALTLNLKKMQDRLLADVVSGLLKRSKDLPADVEMELRRLLLPKSGQAN